MEGGFNGLLLETGNIKNNKIKKHNIDILLYFIILKIIKAAC
jgi:hypothetical protein